MSEIFKAYLKSDHPLIKQALTDRSCKKVNQEALINQNLGTLGDSILKFILSLKYYEDEVKLTERISKYLTDANLVKKIGKYYHIIQYIKKDQTDKKLPDDYLYKKATRSKSKNCPHKYIATAIEAMIGAIYEINKDLEEIKSIINDWITITDEV